MIRILQGAAILLSLLSYTIADAQDTVSNVHIGFTYPLSTNGKYARAYTNKASFHAIAGVSKSETAFCFSGIASIILEDQRGFVFSGVAQHIGGDAEGFQFAGVVNQVSGTVKGMQFGGFTNIARSVTGVQAAGFANIALDTAIGVQMAGFCNKADLGENQLAGFCNVATARTGVQLAGFCNVAGSTERAQLAGFCNVSKRVKGIQIAGFSNTANDVDGSQVSGFINVAKKVKGVQLAGFINIADSCEYPIGLVNIIRYKGEQTIGVSVDETGTLWGTFRSGSRKLYGILGAGHNPGSGSLRYALEGGIGAHFPIGLFFRFNTEAIVLTWTNFENGAYIRSSVRVFPSMRMGRNLEVFAGPTFNCTGFTGTGSGDKAFSKLWTNNSGDFFSGLNIGGLAGVQVHL